MSSLVLDQTRWLGIIVTVILDKRRCLFLAAVRLLFGSGWTKYFGFAARGYLGFGFFLFFGAFFSQALHP